jgi:hypothetical protein
MPGPARVGKGRNPMPSMEVLCPSHPRDAYSIQSGNKPPDRPGISSDARPVPSGRIT